MNKETRTKYVALLRGINVGGNNIIKMVDLVKTFEKLGFTTVRSYIQSGNVLFTAQEKDPRVVEVQLEQALTKAHKYAATVVVKSEKEIAKIIKNIPSNWDKATDIKCNVIFLRHTIDSKKILKELHPKEGIEEVTYGPGALYWSAKTNTLTRSEMIKLSRSSLYKEMTVRNLNTTKKLSDLLLCAE